MHWQPFGIINHLSGQAVISLWILKYLFSDIGIDFPTLLWLSLLAIKIKVQVYSWSNNLHVTTGASIRIIVWKWTGKTHFPGTYSALTENLYFSHSNFFQVFFILPQLIVPGSPGMCPLHRSKSRWKPLKLIHLFLQYLLIPSHLESGHVYCFK